jgi:hypothetical protein
MNDALLKMYLPDRHPFQELMTAKRAEGLKPRKNAELVEREIVGRIVINASMPTFLPMVGDLDVVVGRDAAALPLGVSIGLAR